MRNSEWVVYELVDPLNGEVLVRDVRPREYVQYLAVYPVVEVGDKGWERVDEVHRAGRTPYFREVGAGWSEVRAKQNADTKAAVANLVAYAVNRNLVHAY